MKFYDDQKQEISTGSGCAWFGTEENFFTFLKSYRPPKTNKRADMHSLRNWPCVLTNQRTCAEFCLEFENGYFDMYSIRFVVEGYIETYQQAEKFCKKIDRAVVKLNKAYTKLIRDSGQEYTYKMCVPQTARLFTSYFQKKKERNEKKHLV